MILFITDSLGGPRDFPEVLYYQDTWVYRVKKALECRKIQSHSIVLYGLDSLRIVKDLFETHVKLYCPQLVIYQVGIVDCAPRSVSKRELRYFKKLPGVLQESIQKFIKNNYGEISKLRDINNVDLSCFEENISILANNFKSIFIPIAPITPEFQVKSPLIKRNAVKYNQILEKYSQVWLEEFESPDQKIMEQMFTADFYHLNRFGHQYLSECFLRSKVVMKIIDECEKQASP